MTISDRAKTHAEDRASWFREISLVTSNKIRAFIFLPWKKYNQQSIDRLNYGAEIAWVGAEKDEEDFLSFIDELLDVFELPQAPEHCPNCQ